MEPTAPRIVALALAVLSISACVVDTADSPAGPPRIVLDDSRFDAGTLEQGTEVRHRFTIRNGGERMLHISGVRAACDCTAIVGDTGVIAPRQAGAIEVSMATDDLAGAVTRTFTVFSNDPANPVTALKVAAEIEPHVITEPRQLYVGEVVRGTRASNEVQLSFPRHAKARALAIKPRGWIAKPQWRNGTRGAGQRFGIEIDSRAPLGKFTETITVRTSHPQRMVVDVQVAGIVVASPPVAD